MLGVANHAPTIDGLTHRRIVKNNGAKIPCTWNAQLHPRKKIIGILAPKGSRVSSNKGIPYHFMANGKITKCTKNDVIKRISGLYPVAPPGLGNPAQFPLKSSKAP